MNWLMVNNNVQVHCTCTCMCIIILCTFNFVHCHTCTSDLSFQLECPVGNYSEGVSNSPCEPCPANSQSTQTGMAECPCDLHGVIQSS